MSGHDTYPDYTHNIVSWLGPVPAHWKYKRLKFAARLVRKRIDSAETDMPFVGLEHIKPWTGRRTYDNASASESLVSVFQPGDVLFGKLRPYLAKVHLAEEAGTCTGELLVLRAEPDLLPLYLRYYLASRDFINNVNSSSFGSKMPRANWEFIGDQIQLLPPLNEQQAIVDFLQEHITRLDALLERKQLLLRRLAEQRTALITQAVTQGLNAAAPLKESEIELHPNIPGHWNVKKVTRVFRRIGSGTTPDTIESLYYDGGNYLWVTTSELREKIVFDTKKKVTQLAIDEHSALKIYKAGAVVIAMYGATIGRLGILGKDATVNQACCVFEKPTAEIDEKYFYYWLWMWRPVIISLSSGGGQPNLSQDILRQMKVPLPPRSEQKEIASFLDARLKGISTNIGVLERGVKRLQEYRSALITAAVTGQIDVRAAIAAD